MNGAFGWVRRWGISLVSLVAGLLTLFVFRRELPHIRWIIGYLLLLWLLVALSVQVREPFQASRAGRLVLSATDYTIQSLYHGVLLFLLPAYWASTTLDSPNVVFLLLLVAMALLATFDPWYRPVVERVPAVTDVFALLSLFAALNLALPLIGVPPFWAMLASAWVAVIGVSPALRRSRGWPWGRAFRFTAVGGIGAVVLVLFIRAGIPPAPLFVARATLARAVANAEPVDPLDSTITVDDLRRVVAFTAVYAPAGLSQPIAHVWRHEGRAVGTVRLSPIHGGRREGFRTYSRKTILPPQTVGRWSVDVVTDSGQLIGRLRFHVTP